MSNSIKRFSLFKKSNNTGNTEKKLNISSWENKKFLNDKTIEKIWKTFVKDPKTKIIGWRNEGPEENNYLTINDILQHLHDIYMLIKDRYDSINKRITQSFKLEVKSLYQICQNPSKSKLDKSEIIAIKKLKNLCKKTLDTFDFVKFKEQKKINFFNKSNKNKEKNGPFQVGMLQKKKMKY